MYNLLSCHAHYPILFSLHTGYPTEVTVDSSIQEVGGYLVINLTVTDSSSAPASALDIFVSGLEDNETIINFAQPILPGEAVVFPAAVSVSLEEVNHGAYTLIVNAQNMLGSSTALSSVFYYPLVTPCKSVLFYSLLPLIPYVHRFIW